MKKIKITKNKLKKMYLNKKITSEEIAPYFNYSKSTILKKLRKFKLKVRKPLTRKANIPSKSLLKKLYANKKLSTWKIEKEYGYCRGTIHKKLKEYGIKARNRTDSHIIYPRKKFSGNLKEKAYILGFSIGDLRVRKQYKNSETIRVDCGSTKPEQIELIKKMFSSYGHIWISKINNGKKQIEVGLDKTFDFLLEKNISWVFGDEKRFFSFLAGFTDAEGSFGIYKNMGLFQMGNYDNLILEKIKENLSKFGIYTKLYIDKRCGKENCEGYRYKQDYWHLRLMKKHQLLKFINLLKPYIKHEKRINDMMKVESNIIERNIKYGE